MSLLNLAAHTDDPKRILELCEEGVGLLERLTAEHGAREYEPELAVAYHNRTAAMLELASHERNAARVRQALASNGETLAISAAPAKDAELLVLRHENAVLRRHAGRIR